GTSPRQIREECEKSLLRLGTDYIDLYYLHMDDENTTLEESLYTLTELKKEGKIRYIGLSNFKTERVKEAFKISEREGFDAPICIQQRYTYLKPRPDADFGRQATADEELFELSKKTGISILAYSPLLSGYYVDRTKKLPEQYLTEEIDERIERLHRVARKMEITPTQLVYAWLLNLSPEVLPIVAVSRSEQFKEAKAAFELKLTKEIMNELK
ncbi:MAG: aldo/keto reductase, partial [Clostridia bacterium]|nr:aldo/keto reductase [Clostridia bacterium]